MRRARHDEESAERGKAAKFIYATGGMMDLKTATQIRDHLFKSVDELNEALIDFQGVSSDAEFKVYQSAVGRLMAQIWEHLLAPVFREYSELKPEELKDDF
jgi:hypothetical protein